MKKLLFITIAILNISCKDSILYEGGHVPGSSLSARHKDSELSQQVQLVSQSPRQLIRTGWLALKVNDLIATKQVIDTLCKRTGAYMASEEHDNLSGSLNSDLKIRVPSKEFDQLIEQIKKLADEVSHSSIEAQDVTEEYMDAEARLKNKKQLEARYTDLLRNAKSVSDILAIESNLNQVRSDIESLEGKINYLRNQVSYCTLHVNLYQPTGTDYGFFGKIGPAIAQGWDNLLDFLLGLLKIWPFLILLPVAFWGFRKVWRRFRRPAGS